MDKNIYIYINLGGCKSIHTIDRRSSSDISLGRKESPNQPWVSPHDDVNPSSLPDGGAYMGLASPHCHLQLPGTLIFFSLSYQFCLYAIPTISQYYFAPQTPTHPHAACTDILLLQTFVLNAQASSFEDKHQGSYSCTDHSFFRCLL